MILTDLGIILGSFWDVVLLLLLLLMLLLSLLLLSLSVESGPRLSSFESGPRLPSEKSGQVAAAAGALAPAGASSLSMAAARLGRAGEP